MNKYYINNTKIATRPKKPSLNMKLNSNLSHHFLLRSNDLICFTFSYCMTSTDSFLSTFRKREKLDIIFMKFLEQWMSRLHLVCYVSENGSSLRLLDLVTECVDLFSWDGDPLLSLHSLSLSISLTQTPVTLSSDTPCEKEPYF